MKYSEMFSVPIIPILVGVVIGGLMFEIYDYMVGVYPLLSDGSYQFIAMLTCCLISLWISKRIKSG